MKKTKTKSLFGKKTHNLLQAIGKLGAQKHLSALRDGFALSIPLTIAGGIAIFFITVVFGGWGGEKTSLLGLLAHSAGGTKVSFSSMVTTENSWQLIGAWKTIQDYAIKVFEWINGATLGLLSIYVVFLVSYAMGIIKRHKSPVLVALISFACFIIFTGGVDTKLFSAKGMLVAIIAAFVGSELFCFFSSWKRLEIKLPSSVPPAVGRGLSALFPAFLTVFSVAMINVLASLPFIWAHSWANDPTKLFTSVSYVITAFIQTPFIEIVKNGAQVPLLFIYVCAVCFLWFFGVHGGNTITSIFAPIALLLWIGNLSGEKNIFTAGIADSFAFIGGSGGTIVLVFLALYLLPKGSPTKEVAKFAAPTGIFQINEPVIFGFPIMFNAKWFIPFIFGPVLALIWPVIAIQTNLMSPQILLAPWTSPPFIMGLITTKFDWRSIIVSFLSIATIATIYLPFVFLQKKEDKKMLKIKVSPNNKSGKYEI